jgi:hypothetical protein
VWFGDLLLYLNQYPIFEQIRKHRPRQASFGVYTPLKF